MFIKSVKVLINAKYSMVALQRPLLSQFIARGGWGLGGGILHDIGGWGGYDISPYTMAILRL